MSTKFIKIFACVLVSVFLAFVLFLFALMLVFILGQYKDGSADGMNFGYSKMRKAAFCYGNDDAGEITEFTVPDEFEGYPVTMLGGYIGRGFPCPFAIRVGVEEDASLCYDIEVKPWDEHYQKLFTVHLGKNLKELSLVDGKFYAVKNYGMGEEEDVLFKICYYFTVDSENQTFYAKDGKLYYRESGRLVEEFFYD